ncbi:hypothetical protein F2Q68_00032878 [Brassica cretica]|uniref:Uncharacterized protein n=1 Tax=Brassica cretica TaxID=69181 RepID=A0A8S9GDD9_BRACR|nr:hypothetical protein F2Q68_00032878 [Brassica cretica]
MPKTSRNSIQLSRERFTIERPKANNCSNREGGKRYYITYLCFQKLEGKTHKECFRSPQIQIRNPRNLQAILHTQKGPIEGFRVRRAFGETRNWKKETNFGFFLEGCDLMEAKRAHRELRSISPGGLGCDGVGIAEQSF